MTIVFLAGIFLGFTLGIFTMCLFQMAKEIDEDAGRKKSKR